MAEVYAAAAPGLDALVLLVGTLEGDSLIDQTERGNCEGDALSFIDALGS